MRQRTNLDLQLLQGRYAVCRLEPSASLPAWAWAGTGFVTVTRTDDELSVLCDASLVPHDFQGYGDDGHGVHAERDWVCIKLVGPFAFTLTGILTSVLEPLRDAGVGIFAVSTFDTDYVLLKAHQLHIGLRALEDWGHRVQR